MRTWEDALNPCGHADVLADRARALAEQRAAIAALRGTIPDIIPATRRQRARMSPWTAFRIRQLRAAIGPKCSQQVMANELGVSEGTYRNWESGYTRPGNVEHLEKLNALAQERGMV